MKELFSAGVDGVGFGGVGFMRHVPIQQAGLQGPGAAQAPGDGSQILDKSFLQNVGGVAVFADLFRVDSEVFIVEDEGFGKEAVRERISGNARVSCCCDGTAGARRVFSRFLFL